MCPSRSGFIPKMPCDKHLGKLSKISFPSNEKEKKTIFFSQRSHFFILFFPLLLLQNFLLSLISYTVNSWKIERNFRVLLKKGHLKWFPWIFFGNFYFRLRKKRFIVLCFFDVKKNLILLSARQKVDSVDAKSYKWKWSGT